VIVLGRAHRRRYCRRGGWEMTARRICQRSGESVKHPFSARSRGEPRQRTPKRAAEKPPLVVSEGCVAYSPAASRGAASVFCLASRSSPVV
jgi:UDP:flavonoid glycosyltransferase YjiC (YdhE family)